jgi:hypothetical protein
MDHFSSKRNRRVEFTYIAQFRHRLDFFNVTLIPADFALLEHYFDLVFHGMSALGIPAPISSTRRYEIVLESK